MLLNVAETDGETGGASETLLAHIHMDYMLLNTE